MEQWNNEQGTMEIYFLEVLFMSSFTTNPARFNEFDAGVTVNIYSLEKQLPTSYLQGNIYSPVIIYQELNTPGSPFFW